MDPSKQLICSISYKWICYLFCLSFAHIIQIENCLNEAQCVFFDINLADFIYLLSQLLHIIKKTLIHWWEYQAAMASKYVGILFCILHFSTWAIYNLNTRNAFVLKQRVFDKEILNWINIPFFAFIL